MLLLWNPFSEHANFSQTKIYYHKKITLYGSDYLTVTILFKTLLDKKKQNKHWISDGSILNGKLRVIKKIQTGQTKRKHSD